MIKADQLTDIKARQAALLEFLGDRVLIIASAYEKVRNSDVFHQFRQDSYFNYLTGFPEPGAVAVFDPQAEENKTTYFVRESNRFKEMWDGFRFGIDGTQEVFTPDVTYDSKTLEEVLLKQTYDRRIALICEEGHPLEKQLLAVTEGFRCETTKLETLNFLNISRSVKSAWEIAQMRQSSKISVDGHHAAMRRVTTADNECQLHAEFNYTCMNAKAHLQAYPSIVASADNATCLHYGANDQPIVRDKMVLIDAGCEVNGYAADITRTFPASGSFSDVEKKCYEIVLKAQNAAIEEVKPGSCLARIHDVATQSLVESLIEMGILSGSVEENIANRTYRDYYPHGTGHWLGLDVHDVGPDKDTPFVAGMAITIEPGFYVQDYNEDVAAEYKGIGIRIEDNIVVTADGYENLTANCAKTVADVEAMVKSAL